MVTGDASLVTLLNGILAPVIIISILFAAGNLSTPVMSRC